jgi:hypothetical protein
VSARRNVRSESRVNRQQFVNKRFVEIATVHSFGRSKPVVFLMGSLQIGTPVGTSSTIIKLTEPYETRALLPMQQIHPLLGSVMT